MNFIDMFCGIGTIRMGMEQAGHECVYSIEWDKHKRKIYEIIFGGEPDAADIRAVSGGGLPGADCWCFGAPCQDFSIAGKREGLEGDRSSLVREVFRLLREIEEEHRPKYLLYENVKGMLSSNKGFDFLEILVEMESLGYDRIEYSLHNSKNFGIPQNRERVFTIGHLRGRSTGKVFPIGGSHAIPEKSGTERQAENKDCVSAITKNYAKGVHSGGETYIQCVGNIMPSGNKNNSVPGRVYDINGISPCLRTPTGGKTTPIITAMAGVRACLTPDRLEKRQNGRRFKEDGEPMFTLTKQDIHGVELQGRIRRLTPKECWRLQGIPDSITDKVIEAGISDTQMYRGAGDACTLNVIYEIAKRMS